MTALGAIGLVLAMIGLYGVVSYTASRRTFEIGVRMALGATRSSVVRLFLRDSLSVVAAGCVAGGVSAVALAQAMRTVLGVDRSQADPLALAGVLALLLVVALGASLWPARRVASADPVTALRHD